VNLGVECKIKLNVSPFGHGIEGLELGAKPSMP
jgi:hypothetical protein